MRVAIYLRISTTDGRQDTGNQLLQLQDFCRSQKWKVVFIFEDHISGKNSERPQFKQMMLAASQHQFDLLLFWSLDRLSRQGVYPTLQILQQLIGYGVNYKSFTEQYLDSCGMFRDAVISILATIAKQERVRLSERTKAGLARVIKEQKPGPHGYIGPGKPGRPVNLVEIRQMREAGESFQKIADTLGFSKTWILKLVHQDAKKGDKDPLQ